MLLHREQENRDVAKESKRPNKSQRQCQSQCQSQCPSKCSKLPGAREKNQLKSQESGYCEACK